MYWLRLEEEKDAEPEKDDKDDDEEDDEEESENIVNEEQSELEILGETLGLTRSEKH